jgi:hypothetical protein
VLFQLRKGIEDTKRDLTTRQNMAQPSPRMAALIFLALLSRIFNFAQYSFSEPKRGSCQSRASVQSFSDLL